MRKLSWIVLLLLVACTSSAEDARVPATAPATSAPTQPSTAITVAQATATMSPPTPTTTPLPPTSAPTATTAPSATAVPAPALSATWSYPIGLPDRVPGDGFFIRHGYITENTWYNPGYWHTGEDWYALDGDMCIRTKKLDTKQKSWIQANKVEHC